MVQRPVRPGVGGPPDRPAQGVHRVAEDDEQPPEARLPRLAGEMLRQGAVGLQLGHAHVRHAAAHRRDGPGGGEEEHVAVEERALGHGLHLRQGAVVPGPGDLAHLRLPAGRGGLVQVPDADGRDHVPPQQLQGGEQSGAHVPQGQEVDPLLPGPGRDELQRPLPAGAPDVHRRQPARLQGGAGLLGQRRGLRQPPGVQPVDAGLRQLAGVRGPPGGGGPGGIALDRVQRSFQHSVSSLSSGHRRNSRIRSSCWRSLSRQTEADRFGS